MVTAAASKDPGQGGDTSERHGRGSHPHTGSFQALGLLTLVSPCDALENIPRSFHNLEDHSPTRAAVCTGPSHAPISARCPGDPATRPWEPKPQNLPVCLFLTRGPEGWGCMQSGLNQPPEVEGSDT